MIGKKVQGIIILLILSLTTNIYAQDFRQQERELLRSFLEMQLVDVQTRFTTLSPRFRERLQEVLSQAGSMNYAFDSLSQFVKVVSSPDKKLRTFSYNEKSGKGNRTFSTVMQFTDAAAHTHTNIMSGNDVLYYQWHQVPVNGVMHYLSFGEGAQHPRTHFKRVNAFRITEQGMVWVNGLFNWNPAYTDAILLQAGKRKKIKLKYKDEKNLLIFREFIPKDFDGLKFRKGKKIRLTIQDGYFQRR